MNIKHLAFALICFISCVNLAALSVKDKAFETYPKISSMFGITFASEESIYMNSMDVVSISMQTYVSGNLEVKEIVVDLKASVSQVRIYHARNMSITDGAKIAAEKSPESDRFARTLSKAEIASDKAKEKLKIEDSSVARVYKEYPQGTSAKTIEFAISSVDELKSLYKRLIDDFTTVPSDYPQKDLFLQNTVQDKDRKVIQYHIGGDRPIVNNLRNKIYKVD